MGFKSVLGITTRPQFFSRTGSFGFDADYARTLIGQLTPKMNRIPVLRVAKPLIAQVEAGNDGVLDSLMTWATTVVKLPLEPGCDWLSSDIQAFPAEFLLFAAQVHSLKFVHEEAKLERDIHVSRDGQEIQIAEQEKRTRWKVFSTIVQPSESARKDAGELADRNELPLSWAVPLDGRTTRGKFWAFFPTEYQTTLSGILNAPWKTNEDRWNLLKGEFNSYLLSRASELVLQSLQELTRPDDPGFVVDVLPARLEESPNWADAELNGKIYSLGRGRACVPDQSGQLAVPMRLNIPPPGMPQAAIDAWSSYSGRPQDWSHASLGQRTRRTRLERLATTTSKPAASVRTWLEALTTDKSAPASIAALKCAGAIREANRYDHEVEEAHIVLTADGQWTPPDSEHVFLASEYAPGTGEMSLVHPDVASDEGARAALQSFGIQAADIDGELRALVDAGFANYSASDWQRFWRLATQVGLASIKILSDATHRGELCVRTLAGEFRPIIRALLPGPIVPGDGTRDSKVTIAAELDSSGLDLLRSLGAVPAPVSDYPSGGSRWRWAYRNAMVAWYIEATKTNPQTDKLVFDRDRCVGPLDVIYELSDEGKALFCEAILEQKDERWTITHYSQKKYPALTVPAPSTWMVQRQGRLHTTLGIRSVQECFSPSLTQLSDFLPVANISANGSELISLRNEIEEVRREEWADALEISENTKDEVKLGQLYGAAAAFIKPPAKINCRVSNSFELHSPDQITAARSSSELDILVRRGIPTVLANPSAAELLCQKWKLRSAQIVIQTEVQVGDAAPPIAALDRFPGLFGLLPRDIELVACSSILVDEVTDAGKHSKPTQFCLEGSTAFYDDSISDRDLLGALVKALDVPLEDSELDLMVEGGSVALRQELIQRIQQVKDVPEKLARALGGERLRRRLPTTLIDAVLSRNHKKSLSDLQAGQLAVALYGADVLREYRAEMQDAGLRPPSRWAGSLAARAFVRELGFPDEYAGFEMPSREPLIEVAGPPPLRPLHGFQEQIAAQLRKLLRGEAGRRGFISLPTGAGKTRIAVEAIIDAVKEKEIARPVLWVAQSDELCEQAVQTWNDTWRAIGTRSVLHISRLWGANRAGPVPSPHVVVATIQKLEGCFDNARYDWLRHLGCLVIDEAHAAITPSYTRLLEWARFGRDRDKDPCALLGLSATPFRGNEEESHRLAARFDQRRLDQGVFSDEPYRELQRMGVLAQVRHELLEGTRMELTQEELEHFRLYRKVPPSVESRLGADKSRNEAILESVFNKPLDWTMLVFATSVEHAQTLAGLLSLTGIPAMAISAMTDPGVRRFAIEQFRVGKIRVLTNYGVLTQGFDAPAVRALFVARPTFSPNLYQQMIGRGLRGRLNGGKDECLIVNIADNFVQFGEELAFRQFEYLWKQTN